MTENNGVPSLPMGGNFHGKGRNSKGPSHSHLVVIVVVVAVTVIVLLVLFAIGCFCFWRRKHRRTRRIQAHPETGTSVDFSAKKNNSGGMALTVYPSQTSPSLVLKRLLVRNPAVQPDSTFVPSLTLQVQSHRQARPSHRPPQPSTVSPSPIRLSSTRRR